MLFSALRLQHGTAVLGGHNFRVLCRRIITSFCEFLAENQRFQRVLTVKIPEPFLRQSFASLNPALGRVHVVLAVMRAGDAGSRSGNARWHGRHVGGMRSRARGRLAAIAFGAPHNKI